MWPRDIEHIRKLTQEMERMRPWIEQALKNSPSERLEAMREQAQWAAEMAKAIDPKTIRALRDVYVSGDVLRNIQDLEGVLGADGLAAAHVLASRQISRRFPPPDAGHAVREKPRMREISPERVREAEELAASPEVRRLVERADPDQLVEEAATALEQEGPPSPVIVAEDEEVELYGVDLRLPPLFKVTLILYVALQGVASVAGASESVAAIQQAFDDLADLYAVVAATREVQDTREATPEMTGVRGKDLLRFAGSIPAEDLDEMEQVIKEDCERIIPSEW
jgi:hypothetical protein